MNKEKWAQHFKDNYHRQRKTLLAYLGGKCKNCGTEEDLEFDHVVPAEKSFDISRYWGVSRLEEVYRELDKCQLLCEQCHLEKTESDLRKIALERYDKSGLVFKHGLDFGWMKKKCKCEPCLQAKKIFYQKKRDKKIAAGKIVFNPAAHGSKTMYSYHKCKCDICRKGNADRTRKYNAEKKKRKLNPPPYLNG